MCDNGLSGAHVEFATAILHPECAPQYDCKLGEFRCLSRLLPSSRTAHMGDAGFGSSGIHPTDIFVNQLGFVAGGLHPGGRGDQLGTKSHPSEGFILIQERGRASKLGLA